MKIGELESTQKGLAPKALEALQRKIHDEDPRRGTILQILRPIETATPSHHFCLLDEKIEEKGEGEGVQEVELWERRERKIRERRTKSQRTKWRSGHWGAGIAVD